MISDYLISVAVFVQIIANLYMIHRVITKKTVRVFFYGFLTLLFINLLLSFINFCYPLAIILGENIQSYSIPASSFLLSLIVFVIILLDIELLRVFSILNENITQFKLKLLSVFVLLSYIGLALVPQLVKYILLTTNAARYYYNSAQIFALLGIAIDNTTAFYLPFLVYSYKQSKSKLISVSLHEQLKKLVLLNLGVMIIDWCALGISFYISVVKNIFEPVDSQYLPQDGYYLILTEILVGVHSLLQIIILNSLKSLTLTEMEDVPSVAPVTTVQLPRT
ncbi:hypothetical protein HDV06_006675 [Boothiomyces sp. JEL0866]|nr:hypothetical protein HDV06_006675 [Boothiomyces sp. JEL0866]